MFTSLCNHAFCQTKTEAYKLTCRCEICQKNLIDIRNAFKIMYRQYIRNIAFTHENTARFLGSGSRLSSNSQSETNMAEAGDESGVCTLADPGGTEVGDGTGKRSNVQEKKVKRDHKSAVCIIPPEDVWEQIQNIRRIHDKVFVRWMPHINLLYPFLPDVDSNFPDSAEKIKAGFAKIPPFKVTFNKDSFGYFSHRKSATLWLKPAVLETGETSDNAAGVEEKTEPSEPKDHKAATANQPIPKHQQAVLDVQSKLEELFPDFDALSKISELGFQPHLSLGQFKPKDVGKAQDKFKEDWTDISFEVKEIYLISRANFDDPFHVRHAVPLGTDLTVGS